MKNISIKDLLDAGIHFGHRTNRWNPKMSDYIYGHRNGIHIIDLQKTVTLLKQALDVINKYASEHKNILFIGTKRQASDLIQKYAIDCKQYFINKRWLGGMLTNWDTIQNSIKRLKSLEDIVSNKSGLVKTGLIGNCEIEVEGTDVDKDFEDMGLALLAPVGIGFGISINSFYNINFFYNINIFL